MRLLGIVFISVILALIAVRWGILQRITAQGFEITTSYHLLVIGLGLVLMGLILMINFINIKKSVIEQF